MLEPLRLQALESRPCETSELPDADLVVPVPLHWRRQLLRGYNQAESIGRPLARLLGLPFGEALKRPRATAAQAGLGRDHRRANVRQAFRARRPLSGHILLVDDVATTGATLDAAARALRRGGADRVTALAVARTPDPDELAHPPVRPLLRRQSRGIAP